MRILFLATSLAVSRAVATPPAPVGPATPPPPATPSPSTTPAPALPATVLGAPFHLVSAQVKPSVIGATDRLVKLYNKKIDCDAGFLEDTDGLLMVIADIRWEAGHTFVVPNQGDTNDNLYFWDERDDTAIVYAVSGEVKVLKAGKPGELARVRIGGGGPDGANQLPIQEVDLRICEY